MASRNTTQKRSLIVAQKGSRRLGQVRRFGAFKNAFVVFEDNKTEEDIRTSNLRAVGDILESNEKLEAQIYKRIQNLEQRQLETKNAELIAENEKLTAKNDKLTAENEKLTAKNDKLTICEKQKLRSREQSRRLW